MKSIDFTVQMAENPDFLNKGMDFDESSSSNQMQKIQLNINSRNNNEDATSSIFQRDSNSFI